MNRQKVAVTIGAGILHQGMMMNIVDEDSADDRRLVASHLAQILTEKNRGEHDADFWQDLKATHMPAARDLSLIHI